MCGSLKERFRNDLFPLMIARAEARKANRMNRQAQNAGTLASASDILAMRARTFQSSFPSGVTTPSAPPISGSPLGGSSLG